MNSSTVQPPTEQPNEPKPEKLKGFKDIDLRYKIIIFVCAVFFSFGSHFAGISYSHLKKKMKTDLGWSNQQYGLTQAANDIPNTFFPFFAGMIYDKFGTAFGPLVTSLFLLIGNIFVGIGLDVKSFYWILFGRLLYGMGTCSANLIQQIIVSRCFSGENFALTFAIVLALNRFGSFLGSTSMIPASSGTSLSGGTWIATATCAISLLITLFYLGLVKKLRLGSDAIVRSNKGDKKRIFSFRSIFFFPATFWMLILVHFLLSGVQKGFNGFATDLYAKRDNTDDFHSANKTSISLGVSILLYPVLGQLMDRFGKRMFYIILSSFLCLLSFVFLAFTPDVSSYTVMALLAISIPLKSLCLLVTIPSIVSFAHFGAAYALFRSAGSGAASLVDVVSGMLQDKNAQDSYQEVMYMFVAMTSVASVASVAWYFIDQHYYQGSMQMTRTQHTQYLVTKRKRDQEQVEQRVWPKRSMILYNSIGLAIFFVVLAAAVYTFLDFLAGGHLKK